MQTDKTKTGKTAAHTDADKDIAKKAAEAAVSQTDTAATQTGNAEVSDEARSTTKEASESGAQAASQLANQQNGAPGAKAKQPSRGFKGKPQSVDVKSINGSVRFQNPIGDGEDYTFNDQDRIERDSRLATSKVNLVSAKIIKEATAATQRGDGTITGTPQDDEVYQEESDTALKTMVGATRYYDYQHPLFRPNGAAYIGINSISPISGDYVNGLHDKAKAFDAGDTLLFNRLNTRGLPIANQFIAPKRGQFWLRGIRPYAVGKHDLTAVATGQGYDRSGDPAAVTLFQFVPGDDNKPMFDVVDMSILLAEQNQAIDEVMKLATAIDSKYQFGVAERIGKEVEEANLNITDPGEIVTYPDYGYGAQRSTLTDGSIHNGVGQTSACFNSMEKVALFMQYLTDSELFSAYSVINLKNLKENLKYFKANEGRTGVSTQYFDQVFKGQPTPANLNSPTLANYGASMASTNKFDNMPKWMYTFNEMWSRIEVLLNNFIDENGPSSEATAAIRKALVSRESLDQLQETLAIGRFTSGEGATSADIVAVSGTMDIILNFDPNDLVFSANGRVYPSAGYTNLWAKENPEFGTRQHYFVLPIWMQTLMHAADDAQFLTLISDKNAKLVDWFSATASLAIGDGYYLPFNVDTITPNWLFVWYLEAYSYYAKKMFVTQLNASALMRWHKFLASKAIETISNGITVHEYMNTVLNNESLWLKASYRTPADFPLLYKEAMFKFTLGISNSNLGYFGDFNANGRYISVGRPRLQDANYTDYKGFWLKKWDALAESTLTNYNMADFMTRFNANDNFEKGSFGLHSEFTLMVSHNAVRGNIGYGVDAIKHMTRGYKLPQFGADASDYGYQVDPISSMFTRDDFDIVQACDIYQPILFNGNMIDDAIAVPDAFKHFEMAPAWVHQGASILGSTVSGYVRTAIVSGGTVHAAKTRVWGSEYARSAISLSNPAGLALTRYSNLRSACKPSLYGYRRHLPSKVNSILITTNVDSRLIFTRPIESGQIDLSNNSLKADRLSMRFWSFTPDIIDLPNVGNAIDVALIANEIFYDRQICAMDLGHTTNLNYVIFNTGIKLFKSALVLGFAFDNPNAAITSILPWSWEGDYSPLLQDAWKKYHLFALISEEAVDKMNDDRLRYLGTGPSTLNEAFETLIPDVLGKSELLVIGGLHDHLGQDYRSQFMFNDIGNYIIGRPFEFLNRQWSIYSNTNKAFSSKYWK